MHSAVILFKINFEIIREMIDFFLIFFLFLLDFIEFDTEELGKIFVEA